MSTQYGHLATVGPSEGDDPDRAHWDKDSWDHVFVGKYNSSEPEWFAADPERTPVDRLTPADVVEVTHIWSVSYQEYADQAMCAVMRLGDGRWASVETWSDSSGYGCRDGTDWFVGDSFEQIVRWGLSDEARRRLGIEQPEGPRASTDA